MTWLFENPVPAVLIGGFSLAILIGGWLKTGWRSLIVAMVAVIALTVGLVVLERYVVTDREQVDLTLRDIAALVERNDIDKATALEFAPNPEQLKMALKGIKVAAPGIL